MNPGELRNRIELQSYDAAENEVGEETKGWILFRKVWAKIQCVGNGREQIQAEKEKLFMKYEITIRYRKDVIDTSMRVKYKDKVFNIDHVVNYMENNTELHLFCTLIEEGVYNE